MNSYCYIMPLGWFQKLEQLRKEQLSPSNIRPTVNAPEIPYWPVPKQDYFESENRPEMPQESAAAEVIIDLDRI